MRAGQWAALFVAGSLAGCASAPEKKAATVVQDPEALQLVKIETVSAAGPVTGARCGVKNDRAASEIMSPGVAEVIRSARPLEILCFMPGYRVAIQSLESTGDVVGPAATGAVVGGAVSAIVALPLLAIPVMGPLMYMGAVGGSALLGGTINAADQHAKGKIYSYPPTVLVRMVPYDMQSPAFQIAARTAPAETTVTPSALAAPEPIAQAAAVPVVPSATPLAAQAPVASMMLASVSKPRSTEAPVVPISHEIPEFPLDAVKAGVAEGRVRAQLQIDAEGNVTVVRIMESQPVRVFDSAVSETLKRWKFARGPDNRTFEAEIEFRR